MQLSMNAAGASPQVSVYMARGGNLALRLARQGWVSLPGHLDAAQVATMRSEIEAAFAAPQNQADILSPYGCGGILIDLFRMPGVAAQLFTRRTMQRLAELIGPGFVLLPEHAAHRDGFGGWHKDTDMFEHAGIQDHWSADHGIYQCAVYLQDNTLLHGGGLSGVDGSHWVPRPDPRHPESAARYQARCEQAGHLLDTCAGDLVVFHSRLDHRATPRQVAAPYGSKLAVFFMAALDNAHAQAYSAFIHRRPDYRYLRTYRVPEPLQQLARSEGFRWGE
ncbi:MAG: hypothetical protein RI988_1445 [Pseudomonadota bacterium]